MKLDWMPRVIFWLLAAVLLVAPLPLGSNRDWAWSPLALAIAMIGILQAVALPDRDRPGHVPLGSLLPAGIVFAALVFWALLQTVSLPFSGLSNPIVEQTYASLKLDPVRRLAFRPDAVITGVMLWLTYGVAFWCAVHVARDSQRARGLLVAFVVIGVAITLYALVAEAALSLKGEFSSLFPKASRDFSASFINRNNYATYAGLCALATLALLSPHTSSGHQVDLSRGIRLRRLLQRSGGAIALYGTVLVVLAGGLVLSNSRGGMLGFVCGLGAFWILGRQRSFAILAICVGAGLALFFVAGGAELILRFMAIAGEDQSGVQRQAIYKLTLEGIMLRPWTGWGLGSFESVYSLLQPPSIMVFYDKAHDTYLELMLELGIPFGLVLPALVLWIVGRCFAGMRERARNQELPALAIAATVQVGVHAIFDFSLQIPAVALTYAVILGIGWAQSWSSRRTA